MIRYYSDEQIAWAKRVAEAWADEPDDGLKRAVLASIAPTLRDEEPFGGPARVENGTLVPA